MSDIADHASRRRLITEGFEWEPQDIQDILDAHNIYRSETANGNTTAPFNGTQPTAANMNKLFWDPALEKIATDYAKTCPGVAFNRNRHSDLENAQSIATFTFTPPSYVGENRLASSLTTPAMTYVWADYAAFYYYDDNVCMVTVGCDPYKQVVWARTRYVGCGFSICEDQSHPTLFVCNYWPASLGRTPYIKGTPCSECENDRLLCENGLCAGGMSSDFVTGNINVDQCDDGTGRNQCIDIDTTEIPSETEIPITTEIPSETTEYPSDTSTLPILVHVKTLTGAIYSFNFETDRTIMYVKKQIKKELDIPVEQQTLVYERERLENMKTLDAYNIQHGSTLYLISGLKW
eukprot:552414_1